MLYTCWHWCLGDRDMEYEKDGPVYYKKGIDECIMDVRFTPVADDIPEMKTVMKMAEDILQDT